MSIKIFIFLILFGICAADSLVDSIEETTFSVIKQGGFDPNNEELAATNIAKNARGTYGKNEIADLAAYLRGKFRSEFGGNWNCVVTNKGEGDYAGHYKGKFIKLLSRKDTQMFVCAETCIGNCKKFQF